MKQVYLLILGLCCWTAGFGQAMITNGSFENWTNTGQYDEPVNWSTFNSMLFPTNLPLALMSTDAYSGNYALEMTTTKMGSFFLNGQVVGSFEARSRPAAVAGFYKYLPVAADTFQIAVVLTIFNPFTQTDSIIGYGTFSSGTGSTTYSNFTIPIQYLTLTRPDSMRIYMVPGKNHLQPGSRLLVDSLHSLMTVNGLPENRKPVAGFTIFPNPARNSINLMLPEKLQTNFEITVADMLGKVVYREGVKNRTNPEKLPLNISELPPGSYTVKLKDTRTNYSSRLLISD